MPLAMRCRGRQQGLSYPASRTSQCPVKPAALISNYPAAWTTHYLQKHYERFDPVIIQALGQPEPFEWGFATDPSTHSKSNELFEEATRFGIRVRIYCSDSQR
jgi:hypothetical protein